MCVCVREERGDKITAAAAPVKSLITFLSALLIELFGDHLHPLHCMVHLCAARCALFWKPISCLQNKGIFYDWYMTFLSGFVLLNWKIIHVATVKIINNNLMWHLFMEDKSSLVIVKSVQIYFRSLKSTDLSHWQKRTSTLFGLLIWNSQSKQGSFFF